MKNYESGRPFDDVANVSRSYSLPVAVVAGLQVGILAVASIALHHALYGASSLIFGLIVYLIVSGFLEKRVVSLLVSIVVGFLFGGTLFWGVLPRFGSDVSWDGHLCGAIAGGIIAFALTARPRRSGRESP